MWIEHHCFISWDQRSGVFFNLLFIYPDTSEINLGILLSPLPVLRTIPPSQKNDINPNISCLQIAQIPDDSDMSAGSELAPVIRGGEEENPLHLSSTTALIVNYDKRPDLC